MPKMNRGGYFFLIDSIIALSVLSIGVFLLYSYNERDVSTTQPLTVSQNVLSHLSSHRIRNIDNDYGGPSSTLYRNGNITDIDKTLLEQAAEFYYRFRNKGCGFCLDLASSYIGNITIPVPSNYNYVISIDGTTVYNASTMPLNGSRFVIPSRTIVHGLYNKTELYGPYIVEVLSWG
jgi:hypothetical protein